MANRTEALKAVTVRFFARDIKEIQKRAKEKGLPWQIEMRLLMRRALRDDAREVTVLRETT